MNSIAKLAIFATVIVTIKANASINTAEDAEQQSNSLLQCWEPVNADDPAAGYSLSEAIYTMCSYMPHPSNYDKFNVNGVKEIYDDYTTVHNIFKNVAKNHAVLNVCLQEAFAFSGSRHPAQVSFRCMCKRNGCNIPKPLIAFLEYNKKPIPRIIY